MVGGVEGATTMQVMVMMMSMMSMVAMMSMVVVVMVVMETDKVSTLAFARLINRTDVLYTFHFET